MSATQVLEGHRRSTFRPQPRQDQDPRTPVPYTAPAVQAARAILTDLFGSPERRSFAVRLWDGSVTGPTARSGAAFTLVFRRPGALRRMLLPPSELAVGEAYLRGDFDVEGDLESAAGLVETLLGRIRLPAVLARLTVRLLMLPTDDLPTHLVGTQRGQDARTASLLGGRHSRVRDAAAVRYHYDVGNDFYALWLDERLVYSCAYFETGSEDLDTAQTAKLEHLCRKLRLRPSEHLLDIGCGWGALALYAATHYGVHALGITLSERQATLARERIAAAGLADRCRIEVRDYRALPPDAAFDKVVSVGMCEHVGRIALPAYFAQAFRLTRPGGLFLNHCIVDVARPHIVGWRGQLASLLWGEGAFGQRYVFPDGELVAPSELIQRAELAGFETRDVESLREHYALTLRHWGNRLEHRHAPASQLVDEQTYRTWRLYLATSAWRFAARKLGVVQMLLSKTSEDGACQLPLTRVDLYRAAHAPTTSAA